MFRRVRSCIGQHFAMNEMRTVLAMTLLNFEITTDPTHKVDPMPLLVLRSTTGVRVSLTPIY
jgi:cytochrome P450